MMSPGKLKQECTIVVVSHDLHELYEQVRHCSARKLDWVLHDVTYLGCASCSLWTSYR